MNENLELQQIEEQQFVTTKDKLGYTEEYIVVKADNPKKVRVICINMRVGDNWFITRYAELKEKCYSWDYFHTFEKLKRFIEYFLSSEEDDDEY